MTEAAVRLAAGCVLQVAETEVRPEADGWLEHTRLEVVASPSCGWVALTLPPGAALGDHQAKQRLGDGTGVRLGEERWERAPLAADGAGQVVVHTPELLGGDRVILTFDRWIAGSGFVWRPGPARFVSAAARGEVAFTAPGAVDGAAWQSEPPDDWAATFGAPAEVRPTLPAGDVRVSRALTLVVPPGDPLIQLFPGGGSSVVIDETLTFPPAPHERAYPLSAPPDTAIELRSEPPGVARLAQDRGGARVVVAASEGPTRVGVRWTEPDAPIAGERGELDELSVHVDDGEVRWDGDVWMVTRVRGRGLTPSREALVDALDLRFRTAAFPEPGAPIELRGRTADWDTAAQLRPALGQRTTVGDWPADPLFPRKLVKARRSLALTPVEAGLVTWLYALQLHLDAEWALVRPAPLGPGNPLVPVGYDTLVVRVRIGDEVRWIAPTCTVCAPFELPLALQGASVYGPVPEAHTPGPAPGRLEVAIHADEVVWRAEGSAALSLRERMRELTATDRAAALARWVGGSGAALSWTQGLDQAGGPALVQVRGGTGLREDPLSLPAPGADGTVWVDWVGERVAVRDPAPDDPPPATLDRGPLRYARGYDPSGRWFESLTIAGRRIPGDDAAAVRELRLARAEATRPEPDPATP